MNTVETVVKYTYICQDLFDHYLTDINTGSGEGKKKRLDILI